MEPDNNIADKHPESYLIFLWNLITMIYIHHRIYDILMEPDNNNVQHHHIYYILMEPYNNNLR